MFRIIKVALPKGEDELYLKHYDITGLKIRTSDVERAIRRTLFTPLSPEGKWRKFVDFRVVVTEDVVEAAPADKTLNFSTTIGSQKIILEYESPSETYTKQALQEIMQERMVVASYSASSDGKDIEEIEPAHCVQLEKHKAYLPVANPAYVPYENIRFINGQIFIFNSKEEGIENASIVRFHNLS